jgi:hypothetical protein
MSMGSQVESMAITDAAVEYLPAGLAHAVDTEAPINTRGGVTGYAVCGAAVSSMAGPTLRAACRR